jgi:hypothetical protein
MRDTRVILVYYLHGTYMTPGPSSCKMDRSNYVVNLSLLVFSANPHHVNNVSAYGDLTALRICKPPVCRARRCLKGHDLQFVSDYEYDVFL